MKTVLIVIVVLVLAGAGYYFYRSQYSSQYSMTPMKTTASTAPSNVVVPAGSVNIQGNSFTPATLNAKVGDKITWTNNDGYDHTVTSDTGEFDSGHISSGQTFSFTFTKAGTFTYHCAIHTFMAAQVVVTK